MGCTAFSWTATATTSPACRRRGRWSCGRGMRKASSITAGSSTLFEGVFETDPYYAGTLAAFRAVGAEQCAAGLEEALQQFPGGKPPLDRDRRIRAWHRLGWYWAHPAVCRLWDESPSIPKLLAAYIRKNREAFEQMIG